MCDMSEYYLFWSSTLEHNRWEKKHYALQKKQNRQDSKPSSDIQVAKAMQYQITA